MKRSSQQRDVIIIGNVPVGVAHSGDQFPLRLSQVVPGGIDKQPLHLRVKQKGDLHNVAAPDAADGEDGETVLQHHGLEHKFNVDQPFPPFGVNSQGGKDIFFHPLLHHVVFSLKDGKISQKAVGLLRQAAVLELQLAVNGIVGRDHEHEFIGFDNGVVCFRENTFDVFLVGGDKAQVNPVFRQLPVDQLRGEDLGEKDGLGKFRLHALEDLVESVDGGAEHAQPHGRLVLGEEIPVEVVPDGQNLAAGLYVFFSRLCGNQKVFLPDEQRHAQRPLQFAQIDAESGLRDVEMFRCFRDISRFFNL